jgi:predicted NBD/HSP70 family sugar kinase
MPTTARGNNLDSVRRHNLSTVLGLVHRGGPQSRSELTRLTGLNRSTIAALVGELVELGLVFESEPDASNRVGRPSPVVAVNGSVVAISVNPEIDAVTVGIVSLEGRTLERRRYAAEKAPTVEEAVAITVAAIDELRETTDLMATVAGIGIAVPGLVDVNSGRIRHAPHLGWVDEPLSEMLHEATGLPVLAANDASLGVVAERIFGAGRGVDDLIYLNGGASGIGGGVISGGVALGGFAGHAGEFGHIKVSESDAVDSAGLRGTLEAEVYRRALLDALGLSSADPDEFEHALFASTDPSVRAEVDRQLEHLGVALGTVINVLNPELVVLGGFLGSLFAIDPDQLETTIDASSLRASRESVRIRRAQLGSNLLMVGAAELAFGPLLGDPAIGL